MEAPCSNDHMTNNSTDFTVQPCCTIWLSRPILAAAAARFYNILYKVRWSVNNIHTRPHSNDHDLLHGGR